MVLLNLATLGLVAILAVVFRENPDPWIERQLLAPSQAEPIASYAAELEELAGGTYGARIAGASLQEVTSADGQLTVYTLVSEEPPYAGHTYLRNEETGEDRPIVSIWEGDPGSGCGHAHSWSRDSGAVFFCGVGYLPDYGHHALPLVYVVESDTLYYLGRVTEE